MGREKEKEKEKEKEEREGGGKGTGCTSPFDAVRLCLGVLRLLVCVTARACDNTVVGASYHWSDGDGCIRPTQVPSRHLLGWPPYEALDRNGSGPRLTSCRTARSPALLLPSPRTHPNWI